MQHRLSTMALSTGLCRKKGTVLLSTSLAWPAVAGCSRAETFSQHSPISFAQPCNLQSLGDCSRCQSPSSFFQFRRGEAHWGITKDSWNYPNPSSHSPKDIHLSVNGEGRRTKKDSNEMVADSQSPRPLLHQTYSGPTLPIVGFLAFWPLA